jgi:hypothetical protein
MKVSISIRLQRPLDRREATLAGALVLLTGLALFLPDLVGRVGAGLRYVDTRALAGLPNAMDVLSNLPFLVLGVLGLRRLQGLEREHERVSAANLLRPADELPVNALDCAWLFFAGLVLVAAGSTFYHLQPDALRLAADRAGMAVAFAGVLGMAVCERVSPRAGWPAAWFALAGGLLAVAAFHESGDEMPWAVVQFGGMVVVLGLALLRPAPGTARPMGLKLGWIIGFYALAKVFELADGALFEATGHFVSGHSLKHVAAALAALPVLQAVQGLGRHALLHNLRASAVAA